MPVCGKSCPQPNALEVKLFGGLGDQLELLSLVLPWGSRHNVPLRLMTDEKRCQLLEPLLPGHANIEPLIQTLAHPLPGHGHTVWGIGA